MKKLLLIICGITSIQFLNAQTEQETIDWLSSKTTLWNLKSGNNELAEGYGTIAFTPTQIKTSYDLEKQKIAIEWRSLKEIAIKGNLIFLISYNLYKEENYYISIQIYKESSEEKEKYLKALKHMAKLKGAQLIKDDLF